MSWRARLGLFLLALLVNGVIYLSIPVLQALGRRALGLHRDRGRVTAALEPVVRTTEPPREKRNFKPLPSTALRRLVRAETPSSRTLSALDMDLGLASGGEGAAVDAGGVGGGVITYQPGEAETDPVRVGGAEKPEMPLRARREGVAGYVDAVWVVDEGGFSVEVDILREEPPGYGFGREVQKWLKTARWRPATLKKIPVRMRLRQRIDFEVQ